MKAADRGMQADLVFWMNHPSHYQDVFFAALTRQGYNVRVIYYDRMPQHRIELGWDNGAGTLPGGIVSGVREALAALTSLREAVHIIPGYSGRLLPWLTVAASLQRIRWLHWSEPAHPGLRWWLSWPRKYLHALQVNQCALGALAIGDNARRDFIRWGMRRDRIHLLPYSRDGVDKPAAARKAPGEAIVFGFIGAICLRKGVDCILAAFGKVAAQFPRSRLLIIGRNELGETLGNLVAASPGRDRIEIRPAVPATQIYETLAGIDVFVMPSRFDGWGVALHEAAWAGCALISAPSCGAAWHLVQAGRSGFLVEAGCVVALESAMAGYAAQPELALHHGVVARELAAQFSAAANAGRLKSILDGAEADSAKLQP